MLVKKWLCLLFVGTTLPFFCSQEPEGLAHEEKKGDQEERTTLPNMKKKGVSSRLKVSCLVITGVLSLSLFVFLVFLVFFYKPKKPHYACFACQNTAINEKKLWEHYQTTGEILPRESMAYYLCEHQEEIPSGKPRGPSWMTNS